MRISKPNTLIAASVALLISSSLAAAQAPLPATGEERARDSGKVRESGEAANGKINIPAGPLTESLKTLGYTTNTNIVFNPKIIEGLKAPTITDAKDPEQALKQLLTGTQITYKYINQNTVSLLPLRTSANSPSPGSGEGGTLREGEGTEGKLRLAQAEGQTIGEQSESQSSSSDIPAGTKDSDFELKEFDTKGIPEILVRGSRSSNLDIERTEDDVQPYIVISREELQRSDAISLEDYLKSRLPMNVASRSITQETESYGLVQGGIDLRGLGSNQTLILIDGRRIANTSNPSTGFEQPDISGVPLAAIERIEILPGSAGAIFGGSAVGGVINIVKKRDYDGLDIRANYQNTFRSDAENVDLHFNGGFTWNDGKTAVTLGGGHSNSSPLLVNERNFGARSRALTWSNKPDVFSGSYLGVPGRLPNICAATDYGTIAICNQTPLTLKTGEELGSSITSVPAGYAGPSSDGGLALLKNAGNYNLETPRDGQFLLRAPENNTVSLGVRQEVSTNVELQLDGTTSRTKSKVPLGGDVVVAIPASSLNNPFQQDIAVDVPVPGLSRSVGVDSESSTIASSLIAHLSRGWSAIVDGDWSRSEYSYRSKIGTLLTPDGLALAKELALQDMQSSAFDISRQANTDADLIGGPFVSVLKSTSLRFSGPLLQLPAGALTLTGAIEHRREDAHESFLDNLSLNTGPVAFLFPKKHQTVDSYYAEARVPIIDESNHIPLVESLEVQTSVRRDRYKSTSTGDTPTSSSRDGPFDGSTYFSNKVASTDYLVGFKYVPVRDITLRASVGTGFLPPSLSQITPSIQPDSFGSGTVDPRRGGTSVADGFTTILGGNPNLAPEGSTTLSAGVIILPRLLNRLRLSVDFTQIKKRNEAYSADLQFILNNENQYPGRVVRGPNLPGDTPGWAGPIAQIDSSVLNALHSTVKYLDINLDYVLEMGNLGALHFASSITRASRFERQVSLGTPLFDSIGYAGGPLKWKGGGTLTFERGPMTIGWAAQYFNSYSITSADPQGSYVNALLLAVQGSGTIASQTYQDVFFGYRLPDRAGSVLSGIRISLGIQNVFDKQPPILASLSPNAFGGSAYSSYGDPRLRRFSLSIQKSVGY